MGTLGRRRAGRDDTGRLGREADASVVGEGPTKDGEGKKLGSGRGPKGNCLVSKIPIAWRSLKKSNDPSLDLTPTIAL